MKRLAMWLTRVYPRQWRARYRHEFEVLLEDVDLKWRDLLDVIEGGVRIRMEPTRVEPRIVGYELETVVECPREDGSKLRGSLPAQRVKSTAISAPTKMLVLRSRR